MAIGGECDEARSLLLLSQIAGRGEGADRRTGLIFICGECVGICNGFIAGDAPDLKGFPTVYEQPIEKLLAMLGPTEETPRVESR